MAMRPVALEIFRSKKQLADIADSVATLSISGCKCIICITTVSIRSLANNSSGSLSAFGLV